MKTFKYIFTPGNIIIEADDITEATKKLIQKFENGQIHYEVHYIPTPATKNHRLIQNFINDKTIDYRLRIYTYLFAKKLFNDILFDPEKIISDKDEITKHMDIAMTALTNQQNNIILARWKYKQSRKTMKTNFGTTEQNLKSIEDRALTIIKTKYQQSVGMQNVNMDSPIEILNLSTRAYNCLKRGRIETINDLKNAYDDQRLTTIRQLGKTTYKQIEEELNKIINMI